MKKKNTASRFVAFIDILGFKNLVENHTHDYVYKKLNSIMKSINDTESVFKDENKEWIKTWVFSDSIMLISIDDSEYSADVMLLLAAKVVSESLKQELLVKGSIAHGEFTADFEKSIFFGKPLINSFHLEEEMKISSIILHHSCEKKKDSVYYKYQNLIEKIYFEVSGSSRLYLDNTLLFFQKCKEECDAN